MKRTIKLNESDLHRIVKESVNKILKEGRYSGSVNQYEVDFTFFISLGEDRDEYEESIEIKDNLLDLLDTMSEIVEYNVENDGEDWCVNCIANVTSKTINGVDKAMKRLLANADPVWDYHYIKGINTNEYWQP